MPQIPSGAAELVSLRWLETSGVDHSANEEEGWAVMKSNDLSQEQLDKMIKVEESIVANQEVLAKALDASDAYLIDASDEVKAAVKTIVAHLETEGIQKVSEEKDDEKNSGSIARIAMSIVKRLMSKGSEEDKSMDEMLKRLGENWGDFCKEVADIVHGDETGEIKKMEIGKSIDGLQTKVLVEEGE